MRMQMFACTQTQTIYFESRKIITSMAGQSKFLRFIQKIRLQMDG